MHDIHWMVLATLFWNYCELTDASISEISNEDFRYGSIILITTWMAGSSA